MSSFFRIDPAELEDPLSNFEPPQYSSPLEQAFAQEAVAAIDARPFLQIDSLAPVQAAIELLAESQAGCLLVVEDDKLVGVFTERDVLEKVVEKYARVKSEPVANFMTTEPTIVYETDPSATAVAAIAVAGHRHVPVVDLDERVKGVVSPRRVFEFMEHYL